MKGRSVRCPSFDAALGAGASAAGSTHALAVFDLQRYQRRGVWQSAAAGDDGPRLAR